MPSQLLGEPIDSDSQTPTSTESSAHQEVIVKEGLGDIYKATTIVCEIKARATNNSLAEMGREAEDIGKDTQEGHDIDLRIKNEIRVLNDVDSEKAVYLGGGRKQSVEDAISNSSSARKSLHGDATAVHEGMPRLLEVAAERYSAMQVQLEAAFAELAVAQNPDIATALKIKIIKQVIPNAVVNANKIEIKNSQGRSIGKLEDFIGGLYTQTHKLDSHQRGVQELFTQYHRNNLGHPISERNVEYARGKLYSINADTEGNTGWARRHRANVETGAIKLGEASSTTDEKFLKQMEAIDKLVTQWVTNKFQIFPTTQG